MSGRRARPTDVASAREPELLTWSTDSVAPLRQYDFYAEALASAIDPMHVASRPAASFKATLAAVQCGPIVTVRGQGEAHRCVRDTRDIAQSAGRNFHLLVNRTGAWRVRHGSESCLRPGDAFMLDSLREHVIDLGRFDIIHLKLPEAWLAEYLEVPERLIGRVIPYDADWGRPLSDFVRHLQPPLVLRQPALRSVCAESIAMLLALLADRHAASPVAPRAARALYDLVRQNIRLCCTDNPVTAGTISRSVGVSVRTLHRVLAAHGWTFSRLINHERMAIALRMLSSESYRQITSQEIGRRAGFSDGANFARALRAGMGLSPGRFRKRPAREADRRD